MIYFKKYSVTIRIINYLELYNNLDNVYLIKFNMNKSYFNTNFIFKSLQFVQLVFRNLFFT